MTPTPPSSTLSDLELVFLGSGTSAGVPTIGCHCRVCRSEDPRDRRLRPSVCLRYRDPDGNPRVVLVDTSPDLREQALREGLERCDAILFTHDHADHVFGLDDVRRFNALMRAPIDIYADAPTLAFLRRAFRYIFEPEKNLNVSFIARLVPHRIEPARPIALHGLSVTPLALLHGNQPILGFRFDALLPDGELASRPPPPLPFAYLTDVSAIPPETWPHLGGLRSLVLDLLRPAKHPTHLSTEEAIDTAARIGAERTWFIHMTHDILHAEVDGELPAGMALGYDGLAVGAGLFGG